MSNENTTLPYDLIIVGAGPLGLAAACTAQTLGRKFIILDKAGACQSLVADDKPRREESLAYFRAVETNVSGLYTVGSMARNQHIVNGRGNAVGLVERIAAQTGASAT